MSPGAYLLLFGVASTVNSACIESASETTNCISKKCDALATCDSKEGDLVCTCPDGYHDTRGDGTNCVDWNECDGENGGHTCDPITCRNTPGAFACDACPAGYDDANGDGTLCIDCSTPTAPSLTAVTPVSSNQIDLEWSSATACVAVTGYNVYENGSLVGTATSGPVYARDGLSAGTQYCYVITAENAVGSESEGSPEVCASTAMLVDATPLHPKNGVNLLDYTQNDGADLFSGSDTACVGTESGKYNTDCVHTGLMRTFDTGLTDCGGLTATDSLGAFTWACTGIGGAAKMVSVDFAEGKGYAISLISITNRFGRFRWRFGSMVRFTAVPSHPSGGAIRLYSILWGAP